jgi:hypothetical protein
VTETERARQQLAEIGDLVEAARAVAYRQTSTGGSGRSTPGPRDLLDYGAGARLDAVQTALTGWARVVAEERGQGVEAGDEDLIVVAAAFLAQNLEWLRHVPWVDEVLREVGDCVHAMRSVVATPAGRVYLGVCGAAREHGGLCCGGVCFEDDFTDDCECWCHRGEPATCDGDVFGRPDRNAGTCNTCGAYYDQDERRRQNTALVEGKGFRASVIAHAYGISANTIRGWAWVKRDDKGKALNDPKLKPVGHDEQKRPLYLVADVLALEKRARQRREQRAAQGAGMGA